MRLDNAPSLGQPHPDLALPAADRPCGCGSLEFERDAGKVAAKAHDIEPRDGARKVCTRPRLAEGFQLFRAIQVLRRRRSASPAAQPRTLRPAFPHRSQTSACSYCGYSASQFRDHFRIVDRHSDRKELARRQDLFAERGAHRVHRLVHHLAQPQLERHAAQHVGVHVARIPSGSPAGRSCGRLRRAPLPPRPFPSRRSTHASAIESGAAVSLASTIGPASGCCLCRLKRSVTSSGHSMPLMHTSPSPCAACPSPQLKSAPRL